MIECEDCDRYMARICFECAERRAQSARAVGLGDLAEWVRSVGDCSEKDLLRQIDIMLGHIPEEEDIDDEHGEHPDRDDWTGEEAERG